MNPTDIINTTAQWIKTVVIKFNFCPFARKELENETIQYFVAPKPRLDDVLDFFELQCQHMQQNPDIATALVILPQGYEDFYRYLDLVDLAQSEIIDKHFDGIVQLATFHPDYCFEGSEPDDAANYTNRSPYPMLHIISEQSMSEALASYNEPESIPDKNITLARRKGQATMAQLLAQCHINQDKGKDNQTNEK